jgi:CheY-like chemotaxis protein
MKTKPLVLVVEDEVLVRMLAVEVAEEAGFDVISVATADEAIVVLEGGTDVHLMFTDVNMPGSIDGLKLARVVRERWPPVALIVTSGRGEVEMEDLPDGGRFLAKPYDVARLMQTFKEIAGGI